MIPADTLSAVAEYGPMCVRGALLLMFAYHMWQRNLIKGLVALGACAVTFLFGW